MLIGSLKPDPSFFPVFVSIVLPTERSKILRRIRPTGPLGLPVIDLQLPFASAYFSGNWGFKLTAFISLQNDLASFRCDGFVFRIYTLIGLYRRWFYYRHSGGKLLRHENVEDLSDAPIWNQMAHELFHLF